MNTKTKLGIALLALAAFLLIRPIDAASPLHNPVDLNSVAQDVCVDDATGPCLQNEASSATNPTLVPDKTELGTGVGGTGDALALIVAGTEVLALATTPFAATFVDDVTGDSFIPVDNVGAIVSGTSITHRGDGVVNTVTIVITSVALTVGNSATLAVGLNLWDLPAGNITITSTFMSVAIDASSVTITNDTPDVGLGIVIGSGVNALLSDVGATSENILTGQTMTDTNGAVTITSVATHLNVLTGGAHTVHLNFADAWGANTDAVAAITGVVRITYIFNEA